VAKSPPGSEGAESAGASDELVQVAFADDPLEAEMIRGMLESGGIPALMGPRGMDGPMYGHASLRPGFDGGGRRVMVPGPRAEEARTLLARTLAENEGVEEPEIANATYLDDAAGSKPRNYGWVGGMARIYLVSFGTLAVAFGVFLLLRAT
jgi:hypothetical protein